MTSSRRSATPDPPPAGLVVGKLVGPFGLRGDVKLLPLTDFPERLLTGTRPEPTFLITKPFQRSTVKAAIAQALFFDAATVPAA